MNLHETVIARNVYCDEAISSYWSLGLMNMLVVADFGQETASQMAVAVTDPTRLSLRRTFFVTKQSHPFRNWV
jgi:hypothetical protein